MRRQVLNCMAIVVFAMAASSAKCADSGFSFADTQGQYLDILMDGRIVARYMYAHDNSTPERRLETYKPYLHVFDAEGKAPITKGAGGLFPHHHGIFIGWNKIAFSGKSYDLWHMPKADMVHQKFLEQKAGPDQATITSLTSWIVETDKTIVEEERTMNVRRGTTPARIIIDFTSKLKAPLGDLNLDGDPEHSGVHYRPANEVVAKETVYVFPREGADSHKDLDYPWVGESYTLAGKRYSVIEMNHPDNPKNTKFSAYRDYGRFGAFFKAPIKSGDTLTVKYRFMVVDGEMPAVDVIQKSWDEFAGVKEPTPLPKLTVKPAEVTAPAKKSAPAAK